MAFQPASGSRLDPAFVMPVIMTNSLVYNVGDVVKSYTTGFAVKGVAALPILGVVIGFYSKAGNPLTVPAYTPGVLSLPENESWTADADNETVAQVKAMVYCDPVTRWSAQVNGTIGATNASNLPGGRIDVDSANTNYGRVLESTQTRTVTVPANFYNWGTDPNDSTRLIVSIADWEVNPGHVSA